VPALVVRVTGPVTAMYGVPATATAGAGTSFALDVHVTNLGRSSWGHAAVVPTIGRAELEPAARATIVARWVDLGAGVGAGSSATAILPAGLAPGGTADIAFTLTAPAASG